MESWGDTIGGWGSWPVVGVGEARRRPQAPGGERSEPYALQPRGGALATAGAAERRAQPPRARERGAPRRSPRGEARTERQARAVAATWPGPQAPGDVRGHALRAQQPGAGGDSSSSSSGPRPRSVSKLVLA